MIGDQTRDLLPQISCWRTPSTTLTIKLRWYRKDDGAFLSDSNTRNLVIFCPMVLTHHTSNSRKLNVFPESGSFQTFRVFWLTHMEASVSFLEYMAILSVFLTAEHSTSTCFCNIPKQKSNRWETKFAISEYVFKRYLDALGFLKNGVLVWISRKLLVY
jgi:hypothetical protein